MEIAMQLRFGLFALALITAAPGAVLAQDDLIENFVATGLNCKVNDPRPGCNKVWKVPLETLAACQAHSGGDGCDAFFEALRNGATVRVE